MAQYPAVGATVVPSKLVTKADAASGTSLGSNTPVADNGSPDAYGSWAQVVASTAAESYITEMAITIPTSSAPALGDSPITLQLGIGGSGSEVVKFERVVPLSATVAARQSFLMRLDIPLHVTASRRIAVRIKAANTSSTVALSVTLYGLPISQVEGN